MIDLMMIDVDWHRQGLGTRLLQHTEDVLLRQFDELTLESFEGNEQANAFYSKNGWVEVEGHLEDETGASKIVFRKAVTDKKPSL